MSAVRAQEILAVERNGAIRLRGRFAGPWLDSLSEGPDKTFAMPGPDSTGNSRWATAPSR